MNPLHYTKVINVTPPAAILDDASAATTAINTQGYSYCQIWVALGASDVTLAALKVQESNTDSNYTDITGTVLGTDTDAFGAATTLSTVASSTADNNLYCFDIDLRGRKKWLDLVATAGNGSTGTYISAWAILARSQDGIATAAERGAAVIMRV